MFEPKLISSQIYRDWPLHFDPLLPQVVTDAQGEKRALDTGVKILPNGDVSFRVYAPGARSISLESKAFQLDLHKDAEGFFTGILPYDPILAGPHSFDFIVDGACFLCPYVPISWHRNRPVNYIDIPDPDTPYIHIQKVPHGSVTREIYWSETMGRYERCIVYTPPGYMKDTKEYPVLYLQHGMTENEITWEYNGRVSSIVDNLLAEGKCEPCLIVMNNGMIRYRAENHWDSAFEDNLLRDCIPFMEQNYRVKTGRWDRAIAGLSMGSMQASVIGLSHPELFAWIGLFSGFMRISAPDAEQRHLQRLKDAAAFEQQYGVFFRAMGERDGFMSSFLEDDQICKECGIDVLRNYHRVVYPGQTHEFGAWRRALHDFLPLLFRKK